MSTRGKPTNREPSLGPSPKGKQRLTVLAVDDEPLNCEAFRRVFGKYFDVTTAGSVHEALRALDQREYDAVVADFAMPGGDGVSLLERVAHKRPQAARLLLTAYDQLPAVQASRQTGTTQALLIKPWNEEAVVHWVTNLCRLASLRRSLKALRKPDSQT
jgi:two-component system response regulator AtoC/two-component system response regulator HupR/HoxA